MSTGDKKVLSFPIKPETRKVKASNINKLSNRDKVLIFMAVATFVSLVVTFILVLTNTNNPTVINKQEKIQKTDTNKEITATVDKIKKEETSTPEP